MSSAVQDALVTVRSGAPLERAHAAAVFGAIMRGEVEPAQIGALLMGMAVRGESTDEIAGAATAMREAVTPIACRRQALLDTCGTGGSKVPRRNVSTAAAIVLAACGVAVAKHGNRAASSRSGSADVLEALGVDIEAPPETVADCVDEIGVGFLFARSLHPAMRHAAPVRKALGVPTIFNLLGPLTNPARATRQVLGVYAGPERCVDVARALGALGSERVLAIFGELEAPPTGSLGLDDVSPEGETFVAELHQGQVRTTKIAPEDAGLPRHPIAALAGGEPRQNAAALRALLDGEEGAYRDCVCFAGALGLIAVGEQALTPEHLRAAAKRVAAAIDEGAAKRTLQALVEKSHTRPGAAS